MPEGIQEMRKVGNVPQSVAEGKREGRKTPTQISASERKHSTQVEGKSQTPTGRESSETRETRHLETRAPGNGA